MREIINIQIFPLKFWYDIIARMFMIWGEKLLFIVNNNRGGIDH